MLKKVTNNFINKQLKHTATSFKRSFTKKSHESLSLNLIKKNPYLLYGSLGSSVVIAITAITFSLSRENVISLDSSYKVSADELEKHNRVDDCWVAIHGRVYDLTEFIMLHPGGAENIMRYAGRDATPGFHQIHSLDIIVRNLEKSKYLGEFDCDLETFQLEEEISQLHNQEVIEQINNEEILTSYKAPPLAHIFSLSDFETVAKSILPPSTYGYYSTGSCGEHSLNQNNRAYSRIYYKPRCLIDVQNVDLGTEMLGCKTTAPIYITAFAGSRLAHPKAELNLLEGAFKEGIIEMIPTQCSIAFDEFINHSHPGQEQWYQLHFYNNQHLDSEIEIFKKCNQLKNIKGICINVDLSALGHREKDEKSRILNDPEGVLSLFTSLQDIRPSLTWEHIKEFRKQTNLPIMLKGVQSAEDVVLAAENNIQGVILSNHGGRQLDFSRPPVEVLAECRPLLKEKGLENKIQIYVDGGIRRGSDIIKALCLGATGVGLGRPFLFAMSAYGEEGVRRVIQILKEEMIRDMKLLGVKNISELNENYIEISDLKRRNLPVHC